jgi:hypothetical protein
MRDLVHRALALDLAFLFPGLAHQFGNLLLTIQGHSLHLGADTVARAQPAILHACERGAASLRILRHLFGDATPERAPVGPALLQIGELLRIPVREAGHQLEHDESDAQHADPIELAAFVPLVVAMTRALLAAVPVGVQGHVVLRIEAGPPKGLAVSFRPAAGSLPFPLAVGDSLRALQALATRGGAGPLPTAHAAGFVLPLGPVAGVAEA